MDFSAIVMSRYATKKFDGRKIPDAKIDELVELVRFAPSALNLQPWRIKIVTDQKIKEQLKPAAFGQEQVTTCSHLLVFCADPDYDGLIRRLAILLAESGAPQEMQQQVITMAKDYTGAMPPDRKLAWSQAQTFLAAGNALNGATSLGFDSCPMGGFDPAEVARILRIPAPLAVTLLCPVGYAADKPQKKVRFAKKEILI